MVHLKYGNFDDLFKGVTKYLVYNPSLFTFSNSMDAYVENLLLESTSIDCNISLNKFAYTSNKWKHLLNRYFDYDKWVEFKERIVNITGNTFTFYFNQHTKHNGPCLIGMVFTREKKSKPWNGVKVLYRVTELQRRFAADLVFINRLLTDINSTVENVNVSKVEFFFPYAYISGMFINGYLDYFGIDISELNKSDYWINEMLKKHNKYFLPDSEIYTKYKSIERLQLLLQGKKVYPEIKIDELRLDCNVKK